MSSSSPTFHLGSDPATSAPCLYPSRDLVTHAVVLGMTGSGKTGLACVLLEEAALAGVPIIAVDPKGDLGNLALAFPSLRPEDFAPFAPPGEDPAAIAQRARDGLAASGVEPDRLARFAAIPREIWAPGSRIARPMSLLPPLAPPRTDDEGTRDRAIATTSALLSIAGVEGDPVRSPEHALVSHVLLDAWRAGRTLDLASLLRAIQSPPFDRLGAMDLESVVPARERQELAVRINSALASPSMAGLLEGEPLDVQRLLTGTDGRPRISVLSIAHLGDAERAFFVTILLGEIVAWMRAQEGTPSLRAILYMDEIAGYFPPVAMPPTKAPMLTLLKQARAFGLGVVLATQNPVDLDYKGLANCGTWMIGRLQTERDKLRVLDGLEGLAAGSLDRASLDRLLSSLEPRTFLLHDVHAAAPRTFRTRWALSYLRGPLSRDHLRKLGTANVPVPVPGSPSPSPSRPVLPATIRESFVLRPDITPVAYRPGLAIRASIHYVDAKLGVDTYVDTSILTPLGDDGARWPDSWWLPAALPESADPLPDVPFAPLPAIATRDKSYAKWAKDLVAHVVKDRPLVVWHAPDLRLTGAVGETREQLLARAGAAASRTSEDALRDLDAKHATKLAKARTAIEAAQRRYDAASTTGNIDYLDAGAGVLSALTGGRRSIGAAARKGARARERSERARIQLDTARSTLTRLEEEHAAARRALADDHRTASARIEERRIAARKTEVRIERLALVWVPSNI